MSTRRPAPPTSRAARPNSAIYVGPTPSASTATLVPISQSPSPRNSLSSNSPSSKTHSLRPSLTRHHHSSSLTSTSSFTSTINGLPDLPPPPEPILEDLREPPSPVSSGLPSPPATASSASGSTKGTKGMLTEENLGRLEDFAASQFSADRVLAGSPDRQYDLEDGDDTAKFGPPTRKGELLERTKTLAARNRKVLDRMSSISRLSTPSPKPRALPLSSQSSSASSSSKQSSNQSSKKSISRRLSALLPGGSGSETERDDELERPVTPTRKRERLVSAPASPNRIRRDNNATLSPHKRTSLMFADELPTSSSNGRKRGALPREWSAPPEEREYGRNRWASEDLSSEYSSTKSVGREQSKRGGSAESALTLTGGRTLIGESLRAAGLHIGTATVGRSATSMEHRASRDLGQSRRTWTLDEDRHPREPSSRAQSSLSRYSGGELSSTYRQSNFPPTDVPETPRSLMLLREALQAFESRMGGMREGRDVVQNVERVYSIVKEGNRRALEEQIRAEVEGSSSATADVWRRVGGDYRESMRAGEELVRSVTSLLLGMGRVVREDQWHGRSASLDLDTPYSSSRAPSRLAVERDTPSRLSGERERGTTSRLSGELVRDTLARLQMPRRDDVNMDRESPLAHRDRVERYSTPVRELFTQPQDSRPPRQSLDSALLERSQTASKASPLPKPLPTLPSETPSGGTFGRRRKSLTLSLFSPKGTATTTQLQDEEEGKVTFSKPKEGSAMGGLRRARTSSNAQQSPTLSKAQLPGGISRQTSNQSSLMSPGTGSETERPPLRVGMAHAADRAASISRKVPVTGRRENETGGRRRGTITDIWPPAR